MNGVLFPPLVDCPFALTEGSMYDRLLRRFAEYFDPDLCHLGLLFSPEGKRELATAYCEYVDIAHRFGLPSLVFTPTFRANAERCARSRHAGENVNEIATQFVRHLFSGFEVNRPPIYVGGLIGCKNDCYTPQAALSTKEAVTFHRPQVEALIGAAPDLLFGSTLPAISEALGLGLLLSEFSLPYILSFVLSPSGSLLDGTPFAEAIERVESSVSRPPLGYFVNCVHPAVVIESLLAERDRNAPPFTKWIGFQGNTSRRDPRELIHTEKLETEDPTRFALATARLTKEFNLRFVGGCCGTGPEHLAAIGGFLAESRLVTG